MQTRLADRGYLDTHLHVPKSKINIEGVKRALTFTYLEGQDRTPTDLPLYRESEHHLLLPREFFSQDQFDFEIVDCRPKSYRRTQVTSNIKLDHKVLNNGRLISTEETVQHEALSALLTARGGILQLACGKGKTVIALEGIAQLKVPALIVVDNTQLLWQWQKAISQFLNVPGGVGLIQEKIFDWKKWVVLATYQTLANIADKMPEEVRRWFGVVFWDEAHHVNAPTFSRSADLFYGRRYGLTATPERDDGLHVIHQFHFGNVFYRNLKQDLKPRIYFTWTGLELDLNNSAVVEATHASNHELHLSKLSGYFATWMPRLQFILNELRNAIAEERKILVLSTSVAELVNLLSLWNGNTGLYTDLKVAKEEVGSQLDPQEMDKAVADQMEKDVDVLREAKDASSAPLITTYELALARYAVWLKMESLLRKKQNAYVERLLSNKSDAGLMIHKVDAERRTKMLEEKRITFAIMKYGKEGLDNKALDTVLLLEPVSSRNLLQQVMGRVQRAKEGKKTPVMIVLEDNIGPMMAICKKMRKNLRTWPIEDSGPYQYELLNHPRGKR